MVGRRGGPRPRDQWGLAQGQRAVLFVGRLDHQKGIDVLLEAIERLGGRGLQFFLAGDGPQRRMAEAFAAAHPELGVHLLGFVSDLRETFGAADLFVLPSRWEGWPLALAEAMAAGLPCIGANSPGIRDIIEDGKNGLLVPAKNPAVLAEAIERVLADDGLARGLAAAGREHIRGEFLNREKRGGAERCTKKSVRRGQANRTHRACPYGHPQGCNLGP